MTFSVTLRVALFALALGSACEAAAFQPPAAKITCTIDTRAPSGAAMALQQRRFADAERLYGEALAADPNQTAASAGLVRTTLAEGKLPEALAMALKGKTAYPGDPAVLNALAEVRFRRGEVDDAASILNESAHLNPCNGNTQYDMAVYLRLSGMDATAQRRLDMAHQLSPNNPEIQRAWRSSHAEPQTAEQRLAMLKERLANQSLTPEQKDGAEAAIKGIESREKGSCEMVSPVAETRLPIIPLANGAMSSAMDMYAAGLEVQFNGKKRRMEIDTGASGLLLSRSVAKAAGLVPELEFKTGGIGDQGPTGAYVTHVDDIRIGNMEFKNCQVRVLEQNVLNEDGLIGPDVFRDYLVTLDFPGREVRIAPLPKRPDEPAARVPTLETSDQDDRTVSFAESAKDRYIAPEMKDWTPVFRSGHFLIFPTVIGDAPVKLFAMDTGASQSMISPAAAREVTHVNGDSYARVKGISGDVKNVLSAETVSITFARVRQVIHGMQSYDSALVTHQAGVELSGLIGFPTLRELVISIDYRDNLVNVVYDPKHGFHAH